MLFTVLAVLLVAAVTVSAGEDKWAKLKVELNLSDAQVTQLQQKFEQLQPLAAKAKAIKTDLKALKSAATTDENAIKAKKAQLAEIKKEWKERAAAIYSSVLTQEQYAKLQAMEAKHEKSRSAKKY